MKSGKGNQLIRKIIAMRNRKLAAKKLGASMRRVLEEEITKNRAEIAQGAPYIFSEEFENSMLKVMEVRKRNTKVYDTLRYAAATFVTALFIGGILFVGNEEIRASKVGIEIQEWLDNFFLVDEGETSRKEEEVLFDESQIGYLPDGFEKVYENVLFSKVHYKYQNDAGDYIILQVYRDKAALGVDNDEIDQEVALNTAGLEYRYVFKEDTEENIITWIDKNEICYSIISTLDKEELIGIMNSISY